ncbi:MAG: tryptophan--tRNA ligase [Candidatus Micrarchaeaceae archaeon]
MAEEFKVTPYEVEGTVNYDKLVKEFGITPISSELLDRLRRLAGGELHFLLRRGIFFAHRDLGWLLDEYEKGNKFYVYTGIAPSGHMTIGHLVPFMLTKWLQEKFGAEVYIQIPDEEKALIRDKSFEEVHGLAYDDALEIAALGFDPKKTKIFLDTEYAGTLYKYAVRIAKHITFSMIKDAFGFTSQNNVGSIFYTSMQAVPAMLKSAEEGKNVPCLIPLGVDQDVHFRIARDVLPKLGYYKPAILHSKFLPGLSGAPKMSASNPNDTIYLSDSKETIRKKVMNAFTGQQSTAALQRKYGGNPDICSICQYNKFLFEPDDKKLEAIFEGERSGTLLAGEHKEDLVKKVIKFVEEHNRSKERIKDRLGEFILKSR